MNRDVLTRAYDLPEPKRRRLEVTRDLCSGRSIIWLFPKTVKQEPLVQLIRDDFIRHDILGHVLKVEPNATLPGSYIAQQYGIATTPGQKIHAKDLVTNQGLPDVIIIQGLDILTYDELRIWAKFIVDWSQAAKVCDAIGNYPKALLFLTSCYDILKPIKTDVYLGVYWFWGYLSTQELQLLGRASALERGFSYEELLWVQSVIVELAGCDPELLLWAIDNRNVTLENYLDVLNKFAIRRGWSSKWLLENTKGINVPLSSENLQRPDPPIHLRLLWQQGIIEWDTDNGVVMHSAALALLQDTLELEHRIWRGQAKSLLPILDGRRLEVCRFLNRNFPEWKRFCDEAGENNHESKLLLHGSYREPTAEYGTIIKFLTYIATGSSRKWRDYRNLRDSVHCLRQARNYLAHYTPLEQKQFANVISQTTQIQSSVG